MADHGSRRSSRATQLPARYRTEHLYACQPSSANKSSQGNATPPAAFPNPAAGLNKNNVSDSSQHRIAALSSPTSALVVRQTEAVSIERPMVSPQKGNRLPAQTNKLKSKNRLIASHSLPLHNAKQHPSTFEMKDVKMAYLTPALKYWKARQEIWASVSGRKRLMKWPGVALWNQAWVRNADAAHRRLLLDNPPDDFSDSDSDDAKYAESDEEDTGHLDNTNHPGPTWPMLRDPDPGVAGIIHSKVSSDCEVMWPEDWQDKVKKLLCLKSKDEEWIKTVHSGPSAFVSEEEYGYCTTFLCERGFDAAKVLNGKPWAPAKENPTQKSGCRTADREDSDGADVPNPVILSSGIKVVAYN